MTARPSTPTAPLTGSDLQEARRVEAIHRWRVLQAPPDAFKPITSLAAKVFGVPYGTICIIDDQHTWFVDPFGFHLEKIPNHPGLCCSVVEIRAPLFLPDAREHPDSSTHPLVKGEFGMRFYSGVPLRTEDGHHVGTLAVFDQKSMPVNAAQREMLTDLAAVVVREIEVRLAALVEVASESEEKESAQVRAGHLEEALGSHGVIGQAMGILMAQRGHSSEQAFGTLREVSQRSNTKLVEVARRLVDDFDRRTRERPTGD